MSKPTTAKEREQHLKDLASLDAEQGGLSTLNRDFTRRLIADVERLEAEVAEFRLHLEDMGRQVHVRNADVKVLEAERDRLLLDAALDERVR